LDFRLRIEDKIGLTFNLKSAIIVCYSSFLFIALSRSLVIQKIISKYKNSQKEDER
jgi:hypothetical protein